MALETGTYISDLVATNPAAGDLKSQGDDHLRLVKSTVKATFPNVTGAVTGTQDKLNAPTNAVAQATTSGTSIDFTSIPSWVKRISINFAGVSHNGSSSLLIQIGDSGGIEASGYLGSSSALSPAAVFTVNFTTGFGINAQDAANLHHGTVVLTLVDASTNTWAAHGLISQSNVAGAVTVAGSKSLSATLDRVRITTESGSPAFDAGTANIQYD